MELLTILMYNLIYTAVLAPLAFMIITYLCSCSITLAKKHSLNAFELTDNFYSELSALVIKSSLVLAWLLSAMICVAEFIQ